MPTHVRIKPNPIDALANMSARALRNALGTQTRHSGTAYWDNGDGTGIITGDGAHDGINRYDPIADVQLPILDTSGIEAEISKADSQISIINNSITQVNNQLADTNKAIDAQAAKMQAQAQAITQQAAKDKAAVDDSITKLQTQADQLAKQAADDKSALQASIGKLQTQAQAITAQAAKDKTAVDDSVSALATRMTTAETTAQQLAQNVTGIQATVNGQASKLTSFDQRISANASSGAATAKLASDIQQTVRSLSATLTQTTKSVGDTLKQVNAVQATAKQLSDTLTTEYTTSKDADAKYATQAALTATSQGLDAKISSNATTIAGTQKDVTSLQATAKGIQASISDVTKTANSNTTTIATYKTTLDQVSANLTKTTATAQGAVSAAAKAQATADGISATLTKSYTKSADADAKYATQASLKATSDSMSTQFAAQAKTNKGYESQIAQVQATAHGLTQRLSDVTKTATSTQTTVSTLTQTVSGNTSQIKQTMSTAQGLLTKTQQLSNSIDGLKLNLTSNYATKNDVNAISVGGTNLLIDTKAFGTANAASGATGYLDNVGRFGDVYDGFSSRTASASDGVGYVLAEWVVLGVSAGESYTVSFYAKGTGNARIYLYNVANNNIDYAHSASSTGAPVLGGDGQCNIALTSDWKRYWITYHIGAGQPSNKRLLFRNDNKAVWSICAVKLERGTKPTDWSPAPQDMQPAGSYATVKDYAQYQATVQGLSAQIGQVAKTAAGTQTDVNQIKVTAKGLQASLSDVTKTANSTQTTLTQYKATQDQLSAQLTKTTQTAQGAVTAAAKAQATADGISLNLSKNYTSAKDADAKYATQASVKATADGFTAQFGRTANTIAGVQHDVNQIKIDATGIHGTLTQITNGQGVTNKTVKSIQDTVSGMQSTLTSTTTTANSALTNTTTLKTGLNSLNLTMSQHYQQMRAATQQGENLIPNGNADPNATPFNGWKINNGAYEIRFPGKQNHADFLHYNPTQPIPKGHTYRFSMQVRVTAGTCSGNDNIQWGFGTNWTGGTINLAGVGANWVQRTFDLTTPADEAGFYMSSYIGSAGAKTIQFKALSVIDITAAAQAQTSAGTALTNYAKLSADLTGFKSSVGQTYLPKGDAAKTYTTSSQVQQTAKQISAQVVSSYKGADGSGLATQTSLAATKKDILAQVSSTYTTKDGVTQQLNSKVQQTASSLTTTFTNQLNGVQSTASSALSQVHAVASYIREDTEGILVGKTVNGKPTGYSALVGNTGTFDVRDTTGAAYASLRKDRLAFTAPTAGYSDLILGLDARADKSIGVNLRYTTTQAKAKGFDGTNRYGIRFGNVGFEMRTQDGSSLFVEPGGISMESPSGSRIIVDGNGIEIASGNKGSLHIGNGRIEMYDGSGNDMKLSSDMRIHWNYGKCYLGGTTAGRLYAPGDSRLH